MKLSHSKLLPLSCTLLLGCAGPPEPPAPPPVEPEPATVVDAATSRELHFRHAGVAYRCGLDAGFVVRERGDSVQIHLPGQLFVLPRVEAASGTRYATEEASFWSRGEEAVLEVEGTVLSGCRTDLESAPWQVARERGVDFRAVGQEPGWHLEITTGGRIDFVGDYGETTWSGATPRPEVSARGDSIRWSVDARNGSLHVVATDEPCFDVMSGEPYESSVEVVFGGTEYHGCGRFLR